MDLPRPVILFIEADPSYYTYEIHDICVENEIVVYCLHKDLTHIIQPLTLMFGRHLQREWEVACEDFKAAQTMAYEKKINELTFAKVFREVWQKFHIASEIIDVFCESGLSPWNPSQIDYSKFPQEITIHQHRIPREVTEDLPESFEDLPEIKQILPDSVEDLPDSVE